MRSKSYLIKLSRTLKASIKVLNSIPRKTFRFFRFFLFQYILKYSCCRLLNHFYPGNGLYPTSQGAVVLFYVFFLGFWSCWYNWRWRRSIHLFHYWLFCNFFNINRGLLHQHFSLGFYNSLCLCFLFHPIFYILLNLIHLRLILD